MSDDASIYGERKAVTTAQALPAAGLATGAKGPALRVPRAKGDGLGSALPLPMRSGERKSFGGLRALRRRKDAAFEAFYHRNKGPLFKFAMKRVRNYQDAEEIVSETLWSADRHKEGFRNESSEGTWLRSICANLCSDCWRRRQRSLDCESLDELLTKWPGADQGLSRLAAARPEEEIVLDLWLRQAIAALPENERWAFVLIRLCGYGVTEAAEEILDVPRTTLHSHLKAACTRLGVELDEPSYRTGT